MSTKINLNVALVCITSLAIVLLMSFSGTQNGKKIAIVKVYQTDTDFNNAVVTSFPGGTVEKVELMANKVKNYEANDKQIQKSVNALIALGYKLIDVSISNGQSQIITQFIFEE